MTALAGGCACGAVRFTVEGPPVRTGLCHCMTCRKAHAAAFNPFVIFPRDHVRIEGETAVWMSAPDYARNFCPACGAGVFGGYRDSPEIELYLGSFDDCGLFSPDYESWIIRREPWLTALPVRQNERDPKS